MADNNSGPVAIIAIIAIVILVVGAVYFLNGGSFNFNKATTTNITTDTSATPSGTTSVTTGTQKQ